ncbi:restriction endonuclease subunit S [Salmonella enterica]|uniref:restriction endonuclease subunit S n=1 Tax=Salmonella enterica TaxID=28901 RepID=UPI003D64B577
MSRMSYLEKLLDGAEVEWSAVSDVFNLKNGYTPSKTNKEFWENGIIPWFRMDDIRENGQILNDSLQKVSKNAVKGGKLFPANSIIIATSATIGEHALITVPYLSNQRFTNLILKDEFAMRFDIKFLFYYCFLLADWCKKNTTMSSFASVDMDGFKKFQIPVPCPDNPEKSLAIQSEIVRILDTFTALTKELTDKLTNELKLREKQYNYYRDNLLNFNLISGGGNLSDRSFISDMVMFHRLYDDIEVVWMALGDIAEIYGGLTGKNKSDFDNGNVAYISYKSIFSNINIDKSPVDLVRVGVNESQNKVCYGDVLFTASSEIADEAGMSSSVTVQFDESVYLNSFSFGIRFKEGVNLMPEFSKYLFRTRLMRAEIAKTASGVTRFNISKSRFRKILVPLLCPDNPQKSLAVQSEIVRILDAFSTLTHSISEGLPREIELRRKQYEYYRDLLLSFPRSIKSRADNEG